MSKLDIKIEESVKLEDSFIETARHLFEQKSTDLKLKVVKNYNKIENYYIGFISEYTNCLMFNKVKKEVIESFPNFDYVELVLISDKEISSVKRELVYNITFTELKVRRHELSLDATFNNEIDNTVCEINNIKLNIMSEKTEKLTLDDFMNYLGENAENSWLACTSDTFNFKDSEFTLLTGTLSKLCLKTEETVSEDISDADISYNSKLVFAGNFCTTNLLTEESTELSDEVNLEFDFNLTNLKDIIYKK